MEKPLEQLESTTTLKLRSSDDDVPWSLDVPDEETKSGRTEKEKDVEREERKEREQGKAVSMEVTANAGVVRSELRGVERTMRWLALDFMK